MKFIGKNTKEYPSRRPRNINDLDEIYSCDLINLFSRIPEIQFLFSKITDQRFNCIDIFYDTTGNSYGYGSEKTDGSYLILADKFYKISADEIQDLPYNFTEIQYADSNHQGRCFRVRVNNKKEQSWYKVLPVHSSPFVRNKLILPIYNDIHEFRFIVICILYSLSIIVRYRPSIWRSILNGEMQKYRVMIEQLLDIVERVAPEEFLKKITGKEVRVVISGSIYS
jgi:hypothetical protein